MSARQIAALLQSNEELQEDNESTTNVSHPPNNGLTNTRMLSNLPPLSYCGHNYLSTNYNLDWNHNNLSHTVLHHPNFFPSSHIYMQNNIPHIATNNSAMQQICNLGFNAYQLQSQPQLAYTSQNLQQHNVKNSNNLVASGKRKFVPEEVVSKGFDTCIQHPKQAKWNQDPIAASAFDFIAPPTNVDDINITSNPMIFQGNVADKEQGRHFSRTKQPETRSMTSSTLTKKLDPTKAINVPCPPLCGAVFSRTGELVTFNKHGENQ